MKVSKQQENAFTKDLFERIQVGKTFFKYGHRRNIAGRLMISLLSFIIMDISKFK